MSTWSVYGHPIYSTMTAKIDIHQSITFDKPVIVKACRIWLVLNNPPSFTNLEMRIYTEDSSVPANYHLLHSSTNTLDKSDLMTENYACKEVYFEFNNINLSKDREYFFTIAADDYDGTNDSHIAWRNTFPDPIFDLYDGSPTLDASNISLYPLTFYPIFARFDEP